MTQSEFPCQQCGAMLAWDPTAQALTCAYCGFVNPIPQQAADIQELDFNQWMASHVGGEQLAELLLIKCTACGAETELGPNVTADHCAFCGNPIATEGHVERRIKPASLLPFAVARQEAMDRFKHWIGRLWFAPNDLKTFARPEKNRLVGIYVPYWTFDCHTTSYYTGQRGEAYYVTVTVRNSDGTTGTRQERRVRWYPAAGVVWNIFDDVLIMASVALPRQIIQALEPWDLPALIPYQENYLAGFQAQSYQIDLAQGFDHAKERMDPVIRQSIRHDIGGDEQRIFTVNTQYNNITFKHLLLPLWICSYRYRDRVFRFVVNARTGEVQGERPWSWIKITLAVLLVLAIIFAIYYYGGDSPA